MSKQSIIQFGHPTLRQVAPKVTVAEFGTANLKVLSQNLLDSLPENGVGLAAPQINMLKRVFIANLENEVREDENEMGTLTVCVNPEIISSGSTESSDWEGCLSAPGWWGKVTRPDQVTVSFCDVDGNQVKRQLSGFPARVFQHELDHLNGVLYVDRMPNPSQLITDEEFDKLREQQSL